MDIFLIFDALEDLRNCETAFQVALDACVYECPYDAAHDYALYREPGAWLLICDMR